MIGRYAASSERPCVVRSPGHSVATLSPDYGGSCIVVDATCRERESGRSVSRRATTDGVSSGQSVFAAWWAMSIGLSWS